MSRTVAVRHVVVSAATPPLHIICQTGQMAVVCGVVSVVGRRQAAAVPVGLGEVFYLQWTVRSIVRGIQSVTERKHSAEGIQYTTGRGQSDKKRLFSPERGGKTENGSVGSGKGREDWENGSVVSGKGREDWENGSVVSGKGREDWNNGSVISLEWGGKTGITEV